MWGDVNGDGRPDLVYNITGYLGYATYDPAKPDQPWTFHPVTPEGKYHKYSHGIGVGDIDVGGGTVAGIGGTAGQESHGIFAEGSAAITDGTVTGIGGAAEMSCGISVIDFVIEDSAVTAASGTAADESIGIFSMTTFAASGEDTVINARSGPGSISRAIHADNYGNGSAAPLTIASPLAVISPAGGGVSAAVPGIDPSCTAARFIATAGDGTIAATAVRIQIPPPLKIVVQPFGKNVTALGDTSFSVAATGCSSFQWQVSADGGDSWDDITDGATYSGAGTAMLSITGADYGMNRLRYHVVVESAFDSATSSAAALTVNKKAIAITGAAVTSKAYDGTADAAVTGVTFSDADTGMELSTDYAATASFADRYAGTGKSVSVAVSLQNTATANNYTIANSPYAATGHITAAAQTIAAMARNVAMGQSIDLRGSVSSNAPGAAFTFAIDSGGGSLADDGCTYTAPSGEETVAVNVNSAAVDAGGTSDYEYAAAAQQTLTLTVVNKTAATITGITTPDKTYDGAAYTYAGAAAIQENDTSENGIFSYHYSGRDGTAYDSAAAPAQAGSYSLTVTYESDTHLGSAAYEFAVEKKPLTLKADDKSVTVGGAMPAFTYTAAGLAAGDTVTAAPALTPAAADTNTAGTYEIALTGGEVDNTGSYDITRQNGTLTISAAPSGDDDDGDDDGGSSGGGGAPPAPTYNAAVKAGGGSGTTLPVTVAKDSGTASIDIGSQELTSGGTVVTIPRVPDVDAYSVGIPVSSLSGDGQGSLTLNTGAGSVTIPSNMLTGVSDISAGKAEITIGRGDKSALPEDVKAAVGSRPLIRLSLSVDGGQTDWENPDAPVTVSVPYTPEDGEDINAIVVWYLDGDGSLSCVTNGRYDPETGTVTFTTTHFSLYAVGYNGVSYQDVADTAWYRDAVSYLAARGITSGTSATTFSPDATLTRGQFITLLLRACGSEADENAKDNFSDAGNTYYTGYLAAAKRLGISNGVGDGRFAPEQAITRQETFTLLYNALKLLDRLPEGDAGKTLSDFADSGSIAAYAREAMACLAETGVTGGSGGKLDPTAITTRAQMAQVLYNLISK
jgi:hypothetical protein